jgi:hypothetical protein
MENREHGSRGKSAQAAEFHSESVRKSGVGLTVVALLSSCFTWLVFDDSLTRGAVFIVALVLLYFGLRLLLARKMFRSWFEGGRVCWEFPSSLQGRDDSCAIADIARLHCTKIGAAAEPGMLIYHLIQKDGSRKEIGARCMGDVQAFFSRLRQENPAIEYTESRD